MMAINPRREGDSILVDGVDVKRLARKLRSLTQDSSWQPPRDMDAALQIAARLLGFVNLHALNEAASKGQSPFARGGDKVELSLFGRPGADVPSSFGFPHTNFHRIFSEVVDGLTEYYEALDNPGRVAELRESLFATFADCEASQADYEKMRDALESEISKRGWDAPDDSSETLTIDSTAWRAGTPPDEAHRISVAPAEPVTLSVKSIEASNTYTPSFPFPKVGLPKALDQQWQVTVSMGLAHALADVQLHRNDVAFIVGKPMSGKTLIARAAAEQFDARIFDFNVGGDHSLATLLSKHGGRQTIHFLDEPQHTMEHLQAAAAFTINSPTKCVVLVQSQNDVQRFMAEFQKMGGSLAVAHVLNLDTLTLTQVQAPRTTTSAESSPYSAPPGATKIGDNAYAVFSTTRQGVDPFKRSSTQTPPEVTRTRRPKP